MSDRHPTIKEVIAAARRGERVGGRPKPSKRGPGRPRAAADTKVKRNPARICPACGSSWSVYSVKKHSSLCRSCGRRFRNPSKTEKPAAPPATDLADRLRAEAAAKLAPLSEALEHDGLVVEN